MISVTTRSRSTSRACRVLGAVLFAAALVAGTPVRAQDPAADPAERPGMDPFADVLVRRVAAYLGAAGRFQVNAEVTSEQLLDSGHKIQLHRTVSVRVRRPDRLLAEVDADRRHLRFHYDGETLAIQALERNEYAVVDAPGTIDEMLDAVKARLDVSMPLVDLLVSDIHANFERSVTSASYVGLHKLGGVLHHHLLLSNENVDYQIWIRDGADPLPARIVITHPHEAGVPQETAVITGWEFAPQVPNVVFEFDPPADADRLELEPWSGDGEAAETGS